MAVWRCHSSLPSTGESSWSTPLVSPVKRMQRLGPLWHGYYFSRCSLQENKKDGGNAGNDFISLQNLGKIC